MYDNVSELEYKYRLDKENEKDMEEYMGLQDKFKTLNTGDTEFTTEQEAIVKECYELAEFLLGKNRRYGNSALCPARIFSKSSPTEQIRVRLDDKITRLQNVQSDDEEDALLDLLGYLVLLRVCEKQDKQNEMERT